MSYRNILLAGTGIILLSALKIGYTKPLKVTEAPSKSHSHIHHNSPNPNVLEFTQPDGTPIQLRFKGNARLNWYEDLNGFPVIKKNGTYVYQNSLNPSLRRSNFQEVGKIDPKETGIQKFSPQQRQIYFQLTNPDFNFNTTTHFQPNIQSVQASGTVKNLVILLRFADHSNRTLPSPNDYHVLFNSVGGDPDLAPTGSIRDIYLENSYGQFTLNSTVIPWFTLPNTEAYYADGTSGLPGKIHQALVSGLNNADTIVDFSRFDSDSDGFIDAVTFVHSGFAAENAGTDEYGTERADRIWSHKHNINTWTSDENVSVRAYNINPGVWGLSGSDIGRVGVIAHELGHFFGLPDLYDYTVPGSGIGSWGLMANSWGFTGDQLYPPHLSAWSKIQLGWVTPTIISKSGTYSVPQAETNPAIYRINDGYPTGEYLLIENRQPVGIEQTIPQGGLAIWHIDENRSNNTDQGDPDHSSWPLAHYKVALLQADGLYDLEKGLDRGDPGDPYHAGAVSSITDSTTPSTSAYQTGTYVTTNNSISNISHSSSNMSFYYTRSPIVEPEFTHPSGGETFAQGSTETITWDSHGAAPNTSYQLFKGSSDTGAACSASQPITDGAENNSTVFTASNASGQQLWQKSAISPYEGNKHWYAINAPSTTDMMLTSEEFTVPLIEAELSFWHWYELEKFYDGGVIEVSTDGENWLDLRAHINKNIYNTKLNNGSNPLGGRYAFSGSSGGYINTTVDLTEYAGSTLAVRFRLGTDTSAAADGWYVDQISVSGSDTTLVPIGTVASGTSFDWNVTEAPQTNLCLAILASSSPTMVYSGLFDINSVNLPSKPVPVSPINRLKVPANSPMTVVFNEVVEDAGIVRRYQVQRYDRIAKAWSFNSTPMAAGICAQGICRTRVYGIAPQQKAFWRVRALNQSGWGPWSEIALFDAVELPLPSKPVMRSPINRTSVIANSPVTVVFNEVVDDTGTISRYHVQRYDRIARDWSFSSTPLAANICAQGVCRTQVDGLAPQQKAFWRVRARNQSGWGPWSETALFDAVELEVPTKPVARSPINRTKVIANNPVTVVFNEVVDTVGQVNRYHIQRYDRIAKAWNFNSTPLANSICAQGVCRTQVDGLAPQQKAFWRVRARNQSGWGPWSETALFDAVELEVPTKPVARSPINRTKVIANNPVTVVFNEVVDTVGQVNRYHIQRYDRIAKAWNFNSTPLANSICAQGVCRAQVDGLAPQQKAFWRVRARNQLGWGPWSNNAFFDVVEDSVPGEPVLLSPVDRIKVPANSPVTMVFHEAAGEVRPVTQYHIQRYDRIANAWSFNSILSATGICAIGICSTQVDGLPPQQRAFWRVRARNALGWGNWSQNSIFDVE